MAKPLIQIALDFTDMETALEAAKNIQDHVDVIEAGTILVCAEGMHAVRRLRENHPKHIIVADLKVTDAGPVLAKMAFDAGANWLTVCAAAHIETIRAAKKVADSYNDDKEIQIEIYGNWTMEEAQQWADMGIKQAIYHRSRDADIAGVGWQPEDLDKMRALSKLGISVSITGGITVDEIKKFADIPAKTFICGRALANKETGPQVAEELSAEIDKYWR